MHKIIRMELYNTDGSIDIIFKNSNWRCCDLGYTEAQKQATARYNKKAYDRIDVIVPKGKRKVIQDFAKKQGKSTNKFINEAIDRAMAEQEEDA